MQKITSIDGLKYAIQLLEDEQAVKGQLLKEQFLITYQSLRPINLLKGSLKEMASSPFLIENVLGTAIGLASGYLSKKLFIGASGNMFRRLFGSILEFNVTNAVAKHPDAIKTLGQFIFQHIFRRKEKNSEKP